MGIIDQERLLAEISPDAPCGEDLSYDPAYLELDRKAQGTPERVSAGVTLPAEEPNWRELADGCIEFLGRSRDLRLILYLTASALKLEGLPGLRDGVALLRGALEKHWDTAYPQLDPDDKDPTERVNVLVTLVHPAGFLRWVREVPLSDSRQAGSFCLRDIQIATGEVTVPPDPNRPQPDMALIEASFQDTVTEFLQAEAQTVTESIGHLAAIDSLLTEQLGVGNAPNLDPLPKLLEELGKVLQTQLAKRGYGAPPAEGEVVAGAAAAAPGAAPAAGPALSGEVRSPQDVMMALDKICRYYELNEPSSPVPLILRRAQRLVSKSFIEIIRDLSPDAVQQIDVICGLDSGSSSR